MPPVIAKATYTLTFNSMGGSEVAPVTAQYGDRFEQPKSPTLAGKAFKGWFTSTDDGATLGDVFSFSSRETLDIIDTIRTITSGDKEKSWWDTLKSKLG